MRRYLLLCLVTALTICSATLSAQELKSGPQPGDLLPGSFHPLNLNGAFATNPHCLVCEYGLKPVALVFTRDAAKVAGLLQKLDEAVGRNPIAGLKSFAVVLSGDFAKEGEQKEAVGRLQKTAGELKNVVLTIDGPAGPDKYNISKEAEVTVILYHKLRVVANFAYAKGKLTDKEAGEILAAVDKMVAGR